MVKINIVGDFYSYKINGIAFSNELQQQINNADLNVINFEGPISIKGKKAIRKSGPNISQDPDVPVFLKKHGFKLFSLANNHSMDFGGQALDATINCLKEEIVWFTISYIIP